VNEDELARRLEAGDDRHPDDSLRALLADPSVWAEPVPGGADALLAAIQAERDGAAAPATAAPPAPGEPPIAAPVPAAAGPSRPRRWRLVAAAAALALVAGAAGLAVGRGQRDGGSSVDGPQFAIAGTPAAPDASAVATVDPKPAGVAIILEVTGLEAARPGTYYEAWMTGDGGAISAGTFHMRGGDGWIYLWSGVDPAEYPTLNVTLEREDDAARSGEIVLTGRIGA
jgi:hypothetical protein